MQIFKKWTIGSNHQHKMTSRITWCQAKLDMLTQLFKNKMESSRFEWSGPDACHSCLPFHCPALARLQSLPKEIVSFSVGSSSSRVRLSSPLVLLDHYQGISPAVYEEQI